MKVSVICPFYNEELILDKAIEGMLANLKTLQNEWELVIVNDGSLDQSLSIAEAWRKKESRLTVVSYSVNQGRGYALKAGIDAASGDIIVTTEIDLSWGDDIVHRLSDKLIQNPKIDFVVASPNIPGGGYKNVPQKRVSVSRLGNRILGILFSGQFTMNTGMTRAYRRHVIQPLSFREKGKEFHLEVLLKLTALGFKHAEVPAVLEWKDNKLSKDTGQKRKSSSKIPQLIVSHLQFAAMANPIRYFVGASVLLLLAGIGFLIYGIWRYLIGQVTIFVALTGLLLLVLGIVFFGFGILAGQNRYLMEELWAIRMESSEKSK